MSEAVLQILQRIQQLPLEERLALQEHLAIAAETEWNREAEEARRLARHKGIDQATIDRAVDGSHLMLPRPVETGLMAASRCRCGASMCGFEGAARQSVCRHSFKF